jgi:heme exporter protein A
VALRVLELECVRGDELIFQHLSFAAEGGEILQILGANGSGKTSLLRILSGLSTASAGEVQWQVQPAGGNTSLEWSTQIHYLSHAGGVTAALTVEENLRYAMSLAERAPLASLADVLTRLDLRPLQATLCGRLSAGQRQRVALARLLLIPGCIWLLDEPLTALDAAGKALLEVLLCEHAAAGGLALVATHQTLDLTRARTRALLLNESRVA